MVEELIKKNADALEAELEWFLEVINTRIKLHFDKECDCKDIFEIAPPLVENDSSTFANFVNHYQLTFAERIVFVLSLVPYIKPQLLDVFLTINQETGRQLTEFGGIKDNPAKSFIPTVETALFILGGQDLKKRFQYYHIFDAEHYFTKHNIIRLEGSRGNESNYDHPLSLSTEIIDLVTTGRSRKPAFSADFPAKFISTDLEWNDLVLEPYTMEQVLEIKSWIDFGHVMMNGMGLAKKIKPGYRSLFYGPSGTGKTLTASLLGKVTGLDVYKIDLSMVVSKYIGETEKNLEKIFQQAEYKNWILFFDEADALFGRRTSINDAHDRFANQEVSYLLQRVEDYNGVVILSSNMRSNIDEAFVRRFQSIIYFPIPRAGERYKLWSNAFSPKSTIEDKVNFRGIASAYELSGGSIMNVVRYATLMSLKKNTNIVSNEDIHEGIRKEFQKEGKKL